MSSFFLGFERGYLLPFTQRNFLVLFSGSGFHLFVKILQIITSVQEVMVCDQLKFTLGNESGIILLPWSPGVYQEVELKAIGGWKFFPFSPI